MNLNTIIPITLVSSLVCIAVKPLPHALSAQLAAATAVSVGTNVANISTEKSLVNDLGTIIFHHKITRDTEASIVTSDLITIKKSDDLNRINLLSINTILSKYE